MPYIKDQLHLGCGVRRLIDSFSHNTHNHIVSYEPLPTSFYRGWRCSKRFSRQLKTTENIVERLAILLSAFIFLQSPCNSVSSLLVCPCSIFHTTASIFILYRLDDLEMISRIPLEFQILSYYLP